MKESRRYLGVTITASNYREILDNEGRSGINYHTKHLNAYLKGKKIFTHKFMRDEEGQVITDMWGNPRYNEYRVQQEYIPATLDGETGALAD